MRQASFKCETPRLELKSSRSFLAIKQALNRWRHPEVSSEALDVLHRAMHLASYPCIAMAIKIASDLPAFFFAVDLLLPTTIAKGMAQAWVAQFVTPLKCMYDKYDLRVTSQKPHKEHKQHGKHHHHGGGAARPSSNMDLMKPCRLKGGRPCARLPNAAVEKGFNRFNKLM